MRLLVRYYEERPASRGGTQTFEYRRTFHTGDEFWEWVQGRGKGVTYEVRLIEMEETV